MLARWRRAAAVWFWKWGGERYLHWEEGRWGREACKQRWGSEVRLCVWGVSRGGRLFAFRRWGGLRVCAIKMLETQDAFRVSPLLSPLFALKFAPLPPPPPATLPKTEVLQSERAFVSAWVCWHTFWGEGEWCCELEEDFGTSPLVRRYSRDPGSAWLSVLFLLEAHA